MTDLTVLVAMPTSGHVVTATVRSLIKTTQGFAEAGVAFAFLTYEFSDVVFSRNFLVSRFLSDPRFSHMLMIDSDMEFAFEDVMRLIGFGEPFVSAAYPQKRIRWPQIRAAFETEEQEASEERRPTDAVVADSYVYNHQLRDWGGGPWRPRRRGGFLTVPAVGMGLVLIDRSVPERMCETGAAPRRPTHEPMLAERGVTRFHDFFSHRTSSDGGFVYGEDQSFCHRWTVDCGGEIWLDGESAITHWGWAPFHGDYEARSAADFPEAGDD